MDKTKLKTIDEITLKKCVICRRQNWRKSKDYTGLYQPGRGQHLRYIYDKEDNDYCCNECYDVVREVLSNHQRYEDLVPPIGEDWIKETEAFEKTLDLDFTEADILKIIDDENTQ